MKQKQKIILAGIFLLTLFGMFGCGGTETMEEPQDAEGTYLCYVNAGEDALVRKNYEIQGESTDQAVRELIRVMKEEPDSIDYHSVFPENVRITDWELDGGRLTLTFSRAYLRMSGAQEILLRSAVVETFCQVRGVDVVAFLVGDEPLTDQDGQVIGAMGPEDFVKNTGSSLHAYQEKEIRLYFAGKDGAKLVPETVKVRHNINQSVEKLVVEQLIKGPSSQEELAVIPPETKVLGVTVRDHICYVNLDQGFLEGAPGVSPEITVYAIVNSVTESGGASQVQILVNGESNIQYMNRVDLSKPMTRDLDYVEEGAFEEQTTS